MSLAAVVVFAASALLADALYEYAIIPRLSSVRRVPLWWWFGAGLPVIATGLAFGWQVRSIPSFLSCSIAGAVGVNFGNWVSLMGRPGNQPPAIYAPVVYWTQGLAVMVVAVGLLLAIGRLARVLRGSRPQPI